MQIIKNIQKYTIYLKLNPYLWNLLSPFETPRYWSGQQPLFLSSILDFNPAILISACQDITFQTNLISDKYLSTIQPLQVKRPSPNFLQV
jgi:hypothetical protein